MTLSSRKYVENKHLLPKHINQIVLHRHTPFDDSHLLLFSYINVFPISCPGIWQRYYDILYTSSRPSFGISMIHSRAPWIQCMSFIYRAPIIMNPRMYHRHFRLVFVWQRKEDAYDSTSLELMHIMIMNPFLTIILRILTFSTFRMDQECKEQCFTRTTLREDYMTVGPFCFFMVATTNKQMAIRTI